MMNTARLLDSGIGYCSCCKSSISFIIIGGSDTHMIDGLPVARLQDLAIASCGHTCNVISGSSTVFTEGLSNARVTDSVLGPCISGFITSGSPDHQSE